MQRDLAVIRPRSDQFLLFSEPVGIAFEKGDGVVFALPLHPLDPTVVTPGDGCVIDVPQDLLLQLMQRPLGQRAAIKNGGAFLTATQKPCVNENLQVVAQRALTQLENGAELRDAERVLSEHSQNMQAELVAGRLQQGSQWRSGSCRNEVNNVGRCGHGGEAYQRARFTSK